MVEQIRLVYQTFMNILYVLLDPLLAGLVLYCILSINRLKKEMATLKHKIHQLDNN
ncbi:hypothetical protein IGJ02_000191 [Enterococcus sp. DIV0724b]|uniref:hypothetical protein n=1 Tax=Enterococcus sp. DIV0724b TaxID=2774694 RepID=UPI003D3013E7